VELAWLPADSASPLGRRTPKARSRDNRSALSHSHSCGAETVDYSEVDNIAQVLSDMTSGRCPDACIDAVGMEAQAPGFEGLYDRAKQILELESDRPAVLRDIILASRSGGTVSVAGVYGGFVDKFPIGAFMNRSLTLKSGQTHVQRYMRPLLERVQNGEIDPSFVITHRLGLDDASGA
jgi:threonine dehydrogenase-like Zn-dependent dehydrogenase